MTLHLLKTRQVIEDLDLIERVYRYLHYFKQEYVLEVVDGLRVNAVKIFYEHAFSQQRGGVDCTCTPLIQCRPIYNYILHKSLKFTIGSLSFAYLVKGDKIKLDFRFLDISTARLS